MAIYIDDMRRIISSKLTPNSMFVKMTMIRRLIGFGRRQLHTIVSREIIKPSSPTPSHLKTHNLSLLDQMTINSYMPLVTFYPNSEINRINPHDKTLDLKNSLSQTLTKYYSFAGRHARVAPTYVDCNDEGAEFLQASVDRTLTDFLQNSKNEDLYEFFPHGVVHFNSNRGDDDGEQRDEVIPLAIQINHFQCGGVAVAVSLSHKIADASSLAHFINDWARMTQICSGKGTKHEFPNDPVFIPFRNTDFNLMGYTSKRSNDCVQKSFKFPNSKINQLKLKVKVANPTRVEVLNWLLYKCAVAAATKNNSGYFKPTGVYQIINIRGTIVELLPEKTIGNFVMPMQIETTKETEMKAESFIDEFKKQKMKFRGIRNIENALGLLLETSIDEKKEQVDHGFYICSSLCGYPLYEIDFGWGNPVKATLARFIRKNSFVLMDTPDKDGIEAHVYLEKQDMAIFESDPELLAFL